MAKKVAKNSLFHVANEVANPIGGIYAVLSTLAPYLMQDKKRDTIFVGPIAMQSHRYFKKTNTHKEFIASFKRMYNIDIEVGKWLIESSPLTILINPDSLNSSLNEIKGDMWNRFGVDSLHAYGDYDYAAIFGYAAGLVIEHYQQFYDCEKVIAHFHEWNCAFGLLYLKRNERIKTVFTTHATTVGRSIAGNGKPLYDYMSGYYGDQMASELNVQSKHSVEKAAANVADVFTTVSDVTAAEAKQLLEREPLITPNGYCESVIPSAEERREIVKNVRPKLIDIAQQYLGHSLDENIPIIATSGRYEFRNKGLDMFLSVMGRLNKSLSEPLLALVLVPAWHKGVANDNKSLPVTHALYEPYSDPILNMAREVGLVNDENCKVKLLFVPAFLDGKDGVVNEHYFNVLQCVDITLFASYYEPWGYTPLEAASRSIPTITTSLAGFGKYVASLNVAENLGIKVIERNDSNYNSAVEQCVVHIEALLESFKNSNKKRTIRSSAAKIAQRASWNNFVSYYEEIYVSLNN